MRTDRLLHLGTGLMALSLLLALGTTSLRPGADASADLLVLALLGWLQGAALVGGAGMLVGHLVVQALAPPTIEEEIRDWYE